MEEQDNKIKSLLSERKELETSLNHKIQEVQDQVVELRAQNARLGTQIQYADEKEKLLQVNTSYICSEQASSAI